MHKADSHSRYTIYISLWYLLLDTPCFFAVLPMTYCCWFIAAYLKNYFFILHDLLLQSPCLTALFYYTTYCFIAGYPMLFSLYCLWLIAVDLLLYTLWIISLFYMTYCCNLYVLLLYSTRLIAINSMSYCFILHGFLLNSTRLIALFYMTYHCFVHILALFQS